MNPISVASRIPVLRPSLPKAEVLAPYLKRIDANQWYSNFGPLESELRERLGAMAGLSRETVALFSTGTDALACGLRAMTGGRGVCLAPSWTHVGTATAIRLAGLRPHLVDCDLETWALSPQTLTDIAARSGAVAVMPVAPFGGDFDYRAWDRWSAETGVKVLIDAAAGFDRTVASGPLLGWGATPVMISLHATKVLGAGEGGALLCDNADLIRATQKLSNFGIWDQQPSEDAFANCKMSEYAAAVALASLDGWPERRQLLHALARRVVSAWGEAGASFAPGFGGRYVGSTCTVSLPGLKATDMETALGAAGIETRRWWRHGLHRLEAFRHEAREPLPNTECLAEDWLGLPFFPSLSDDQIAHAAEIMRSITSRD